MPSTSPVSLQFGAEVCADVLQLSESSPSATSWRSLYAGSLVPPDPCVCGAIAEVPPLPNPICITSDVPAILEKMLAAIPLKDWETKTILPPIPVKGFPNLCRGPGSLLPGQTPKQVAQNMLAAHILNRLCSNLLSVAAADDKEASQSPKESPEHKALAAARSKAKDAGASLEQATKEDAAAKTAKQAFQEEMSPDMEKGRHVESMVGWKTSVLAQVTAEVAEAKRELTAAEEALKA